MTTPAITDTIRNVRAIQDGNFFYVEGERNGIYAPVRVRDGDVEAAQQAREWFVTFMRRQSLNPIF